MQIIPIYLAIVAALCPSLGLADAPKPPIYYENLATTDHGTSISSPSEGMTGFDLKSLLDYLTFPGPENSGAFVFANKKQHEVFTIDFGTIRRDGLAVIYPMSGDGPVYGAEDRRRPEQILIEASPDGSEGSWKRLRFYSGLDVPRRLSVTWDDQPFRYLRFDLGQNTDGIGSRMGPVTIFPRFKYPTLNQRLKDLDRLFRPNLPALEPFRSALAAGDDTAAVGALREHFAKVQLHPAERFEEYAFQVEEMKKGRVRFLERTWQMPPEGIDWYFFPCELSDEPPSYWSAASPTWYVAGRYYETKDPSYARFAAKWIRQWIADVPCPLVHKIAKFKGEGGDMIYGWPALRAAHRCGGFSNCVVRFAPLRDEFDDETWAHLLYSMWEHAQFLERVTPTLGGNWLTWADERLILTADEYPEFADQPRWLKVGLEGFEKVVRRDVSEDGKEMEDTTYYCLRAIKEIVSAYTVFKKGGLKMAADVETRVRRSLDFPAWIHWPHFGSPGIGDIGVVGLPQKNILMLEKYAAAWGRDDLVYINTHGKQGKKPEQQSRAFLHDGWFILRSDWDDDLDARHLVFRAASRRGHGHKDQLAIVLYAYGRPLLIDPGMTLYGIKGSDRYCETDMHNTITIDGTSQDYLPARVNNWETTPEYDLADGQYAANKQMTHRRRVIFVKPDYYVLIDDISGEGEHTLDWNYQFLKDAKPTAEGPFVRTHFSEGGNVAIWPLPATAITQSGPKSFQYVVVTDEIPSTGWVFQSKGKLPQQLVTVVFPFKGKDLPEGFSASLTRANQLTVSFNSKQDVIAWRPDTTTQPWTFEGDDGAKPITQGAIVIRSKK